MRTSRPLGWALGLALAFVLAGCGRAASSTAPAGTPPPAAVPYASLPAEARAFIALANEHRAALGLAPLAWDDGAAGVAQAHSVDMVARGYFAHVDPDGRSPSQRLTDAGIAWRAAGENIAYGYPTGAAVYAAWMGSPGHRANLESATFTRHGLGLHQGYWTHVFFTP